MTERPPENVRQALGLYEMCFGGSLAPSPRSDVSRAPLGPVDLVDAAGQELAPAFGADTGVEPQGVFPGEIPTHGESVSRGGDIV